MSEAAIFIIALLLIFVGFPWMSWHLTPGHQIAVCGALIFSGLALPILHDWLSD